MVEDPWAELETASAHAQEDTGQAWPHNAWEVTTGGEKEEEREMSESMIAQVGDTLCERNEKMLDDTDTPDDSALNPDQRKIPQQETEPESAD